MTLVAQKAGSAVVHLPSPRLKFAGRVLGKTKCGLQIVRGQWGLYDARAGALERCNVSVCGRCRATGKAGGG